MLRNRVPAPTLAEFTPHDFYFTHARSGEAFFAALDELEQFFHPALQIIEQRYFGSQLRQRYTTELALERGALTRLLGPDVISDAALIGSDPFLRMGSDLTLLFRAKNSRAVVLEKGLGDALARTIEGLGALTTERLAVEGVEVTSNQSEDGRIQRFQARIDDLFIVSNSRTALERVVKTVKKQSPALSEEIDFQYMWRRDQDVQHDVYFFAGEKFVSRIVSPGARVLDARRGLAEKQLRELGYASILSGLYLGRPVTGPETLMKLNLIQEAERRHFDGALISGVHAPKSRWGRPDRMVSLLDLPSVTKVTAEEKEAYEAFRQQYDRTWGEVIDPIALRMKLQPNAGGFDAHLRVVPLYTDRAVRDIARFTRGTYALVEHPGLGLSAMLTIGADSRMRSELSSLSRNTLGGSLKLDWLGDYVFIGMRDTPDVARLAFPHVAPFPRESSPEFTEQEQLERLPAYLGIHLGNQAAFAAALTYFRVQLAKLGDVKFTPAGEILGSPVQEMNFGGFSSYYAIGKSHFFLTTNLETLKALLEHEKADRFAKATSGSGQAGKGHNLTLESQFAPSSAFAQILHWAFESTAQGQQEHYHPSHLWEPQSDAIWLRLALGLSPGDALSPDKTLPLTGSVPLSPDGAFFQVAPSGLSDPARGTRVRFKFPKLPIPDSSLTRVLGGLQLLRLGLSIDQEGRAARGENNSLDSLRTEMVVRRKPVAKN